MDTYQANEAFCIIPILIIYSVVEIHRGWRVLRYKEPSLHLNQQISLAMVRLLRGADAADHNHKLMMDDSENMVFFAWSSFVGGILALIICLVWVVILIKLTM
ncbi:MAG: hypothetical protein HYZ25_18770 [Chloroflexi bacterium]|nr:hypothetical protein [Chloroflexota bacterium]